MPFLHLGQKETAELQKRVSELGDKLNDVQMCMQSVSVRSKKKSLIPKDLCVSLILAQQSCVCAFVLI